MDGGADVGLPAVIDEAQLVSLARGRDMAAFESLAVAYRARLWRLAYRMLKDRGAAEDVVQEVLMTSWSCLPALREPEAFGGWMYRLATNKCLDVLRKRSARPETPADPDDLQGAGETFLGVSDPEDPASMAEHSIRAERLSAELVALSPGQRECWVRREIHGDSYAEISTALDIATSAVRGRLARARHEIAEQMNDWR